MKQWRPELQQWRLSMKQWRPELKQWRPATKQWHPATKQWRPATKTMTSGMGGEGGQFAEIRIGSAPLFRRNIFLMI
jgi:hypothetical protein